jgi:predicted glycoside hydrolase/deacetylase ChbG (UPF0249 family)
MQGESHMDVRETGSATEPHLTSLILPAYNPGRRLECTWNELRGFLAQTSRPWEVLFVCDGCTDGTVERLQELARGEQGRIRVLAHYPNRGKGFAVRRGLAEAHGAWRIFTDVDFAYPPSDVLTVAERLWRGADVVIGSRSHPESRVVLPPRLSGYAYRRQVQGMLFSWLARRLLPLRQRDTQAGLKGFSAGALQQLLPLLHCRGFGLDCEILTACARLGLPVVEAPVQVRYDDSSSTTNFRSTLATLGELWQIRRFWRGVTMAPATAVPAPALFDGRAPGASPRLARLSSASHRSRRFLIVTADDFGIGPATSEGILDLAREGVVTAAVLLVNTPFAAEAVQAWRRAGSLPEMGWHPCLTLDSPVLPTSQVPSLVRPDGRFWPLGAFLRRLHLGLIRREDVLAELQAQYERFVTLTGGAPCSVNAHHHLQVFPLVAGVLEEVLAGTTPPPYLRRVREPWSMISRVGGARIKRLGLTLLSHRVQSRLPGNEVLAGATDPRRFTDPQFLVRWVLQVPGRVVEWACHPGHRDETLPGRDGGVEQMRCRVQELQRLQDPRFLEACREAGFTLVAPGRLGQEQVRAA